MVLSDSSRLLQLKWVMLRFAVFSDALLNVPYKGAQTEFWGGKVHLVEFVEDSLYLVVVDDGDERIGN